MSLLKEPNHISQKPKKFCPPRISYKPQEKFGASVFSIIPKSSFENDSLQDLTEISKKHLAEFFSRARGLFQLMNKVRRQSKFVALCFIITGCSGLQESEQKKLRHNHLTLTPLAQIDPPALQPATSEHIPVPTYPWEKKWMGTHRRINKEFFRCRGNASRFNLKLQNQAHRDCHGIDEHSLPVKKNREFIYPILIDLLNYIQDVTGHEVVITCGHRCPRHNTYADPSWNNRTSKHQIGAEVDFYVKGMEHNAKQVIAILVNYYKKYRTYPRECHFSRVKSSFVRTPSWINREIRITLAEADERRDLDNAHPYPYMTIEVLYDPQAKRSVAYSWHRAHYGSFQY